MRADQKFSGVLLSPESDSAKETEAYDRYVKTGKKKKKQGAVSRTKTPYHRASQYSLVNLMGDQT